MTSAAGPQRVMTHTLNIHFSFSACTLLLYVTSKPLLLFFKYLLCLSSQLFYPILFFLNVILRLRLWFIAATTTTIITIITIINNNNNNNNDGDSSPSSRLFHRRLPLLPHRLHRWRRRRTPSPTNLQREGGGGAVEVAPLLRERGGGRLQARYFSFSSYKYFISL